MTPLIIGISLALVIGIVLLWTQLDNHPDAPTGDVPEPPDWW